ncbi:hypothetical protein [Methanofollis ethanolicus]|uniref:hypothetical protein n=1 Tax=Methanofollis ethanolicus TaxID=488124 RepID=UPI0008316EEC|nr:hypothetical protein [Methanofollis ethanolicus]
MMTQTGKITRAHEALRIELEARPGEYLVVGASDARELVATGATVPLYQIIRGDDVDIVQEAGTAYGTKTGKGIALHITTGLPVVPTMYASRAAVEAVHRGARTTAPVSAPEDRPAHQQEPAKRTDAWDSSRLKRGFGDAANPPRGGGRPAPSPVIVV